MTSVAWLDEEETKGSTVRWKGRNLLNFVVGRSSSSRVRALPVVIHFLPEDIDWFSADASLFDELKLLLRERVVSATSNGDKDPEPPRSRKRARKEEVCVQGERLQFIYRYRNTLPKYTVLSYAGENTEGPESSSSSSSEGSGKSKLPEVRKSSDSGGRAGDGGPEFRHLPLSESTLLVWIYRFDRDDPYRAVPNEAALHFAPSATKPSTARQVPLDVEAIGRRSAAGPSGITVGIQGGPRDTGLLAWLWGGDRGGGGGGQGGAAFGGGGGGVRQHFIGSAAWQGKPAAEHGREEEEDDDIQRAIALSLATASRAAGGMEESKG